MRTEKQPFMSGGFWDVSTTSIVVSNVITIIVALTGRWNLGILMWGFWFQSIIIGVFNVFRILSLEKFSTANLKLNKRSVSPTAETKYKLALFFAVHFGGFHLVYSIFLLALFSPLLLIHRFGDIFVISLMFLISHGLDYRRVRALDRQSVPNVGRLLFSPYPRIIPMHITLIFGFIWREAALMLFLSFKTVADIAMHKIDQSQSVKSAQKSTMEQGSITGA
jgi:Family of unknown function (DUF6498)